MELVLEADRVEWGDAVTVAEGNVRATWDGNVVTVAALENATPRELWRCRAVSCDFQFETADALLVHDGAALLRVDRAGRATVLHTNASRVAFAR